MNTGIADCKAENGTVSIWVVENRVCGWDTEPLESERVRPALHRTGTNRAVNQMPKSVVCKRLNIGRETIAGVAPQKNGGLYVLWRASEEFIEYFEEDSGFPGIFPRIHLDIVVGRVFTVVEMAKTDRVCFEDGKAVGVETQVVDVAGGTGGHSAKELQETFEMILGGPCYKDGWH